MDKLPLNALPGILFGEDQELSAYIDSADKQLAELYEGYLPYFEKFLRELPDDLTPMKFRELLLAQPVRIRALTAIRLSDFFDRVSQKDLHRWTNFKSFVVKELWDNHPDKIRWRP